MTWMDWYNSLAKPSWTPAPATIGLIWQILYPIILVTFGFVFVQTIRRKIPWIVALPFAINLVANLIFTPIQFGMRNLPLAAVDILVVWTTILWMAVAIWRHCHTNPLVLPFLVRYRLPTHEYLGYVDCPVHLIHGTKDEKIDFTSSERLKNRCLELKKEVQFHPIQNGYHNLRPESDFETVLKQILEGGGKLPP